MSFKTVLRDLKLASGILLKKPYQCLVQVTNRCNMRCSFCDFWPNGVSPNQELTLDDFQHLADQLTALGCFIISIEGGEPFVRPDLLEIVRILSKKHISVLFTNGWYVDEKKAHAFFDAGLAQVGVSIDYPDALRHDAKRGLVGATEKAWKAIEHFKKAAPQGEKQVQVMTVLMQDNQQDLEALLKLSLEAGVGHSVTLLSTQGFRRKSTDTPPIGPVSEKLLGLHSRYPHFKAFRKYLELMDPFLTGGSMPTCHAGEQSFNIDHVGNVSPCIEKINNVYGNLRKEPLTEIIKRMSGVEEIAHCQDCWTLCRGLSQCMDQRGDLKSWMDLAGRMKTS